METEHVFFGKQIPLKPLERFPMSPFYIGMKELVVTTSFPTPIPMFDLLDFWIILMLVSDTLCQIQRRMQKGGLISVWHIPFSLFCFCWMVFSPLTDFRLLTQSNLSYRPIWRIKKKKSVTQGRSWNKDWIKLYWKIWTYFKLIN